MIRESSLIALRGVRDMPETACQSCEAETLRDTLSSLAPLGLTAMLGAGTCYL